VDKDSLARPGREASTQMRECRSCNGHGLVLVDAEYDFESGELVQEVCECFVCMGEGAVPLFMYARPRRRR